MARLIGLVIHLCLLLSSGSGEDLPGHMQPLGSHREPETVDKIARVPSPEEFNREYVQPKKPVVLAGLLKSTSVLRNWQKDEYLREHFGDEIMNVENGKKENRSQEAFDVTMKEFLDRYQEEDIYMVSAVPDSMLREWVIPRFLLCGGYTTHLMYVYIWFSSGGTKSVLHTDSYENFHCLVSGRKDFVLIEPQYSTVIGPEHRTLGYYYMDVDRVNMTAYPNLSSVPWYKVVVEEGDCLYLPYSWLHNVHSHGRNFGVNIWWTPFEFNAEDCSGDIPDFAPVDNFQFTPELQLKIALLEAAHDGTVSAENILHMMSEHAIVVSLTLELVKNMFELLDPGCNGVIPTSKLDSIALETYKKAFEYIIHAADELVPGRTVGEWEEEEAPPFPDDSETEEADFMYFREGKWEKAVDYNYLETAESLEGGVGPTTPSATPSATPPATPPSQQEKEEL